MGREKRPVVKYDLNEKFIARYDSLKEAAEKNNVSPSTIGKRIKENNLKYQKELWSYEGEDIKYFEKTIPVKNDDFFDSFIKGEISEFRIHQKLLRRYVFHCFYDYQAKTLLNEIKQKFKEWKAKYEFNEEDNLYIVRCYRK